MTTFRSKSNGGESSGTHAEGGLSAFKNRISTCFHQSEQKARQECQDQAYKFHKIYKSIIQCTSSANRRKFHENLQHLIARICGRSKKRKVQIIAKLLPATCTRSTTSVTTITQATITTTSAAAKLHKMTILEDTMVRIRDEHPYLDAEVRSILLSRAQEGSTISEIKEDFRKNVGTNFPIHENVTEFLLSIPMVGAWCTESGTRLFYIIPSDKNKHLYDMVMAQKPVQHSYQSRSHRPIVRKSQLQQPHQQTFWSQSRTTRPSSRSKESDESSNWSVGNAAVSPKMHSHPPTEGDDKQLDEPPPPRDGRKDLTSNGYYRDNCNHFYSRLYTKAPADVDGPAVAHMLEAHSHPDTNNNHYNCNTNTAWETCRDVCSVAHPQHHHQRQQQQQQQQHQQRKQWQYQHHRLLPASGRAMKRPRSGEITSRIYDSAIGLDMLDFEARLLDFPLLGDDFFLYLARMELKCKFKKFERVYQSGLCVSGQTIRAATNRISNSNYCNQTIIVNIGSVDIMQGRSLLQIQYDFRDLISRMLNNGITPILTTLAPLANYAHVESVKEKLERFNSFVKRLSENFLVIDIWKCLVNEKHHIMFDCFQSDPRSVTGADEPHVFWNKIGRQRVLQLIEASIEY